MKRKTIRYFGFGILRACLSIELYHHRQIHNYNYECFVFSNDEIKRTTRHITKLTREKQVSDPTFLNITSV